MADLRARRVALTEATALQGSSGVPILPASLHPSFLAADAMRTPGLEPWFIAVEDGRARWLHGILVGRIGRLEGRFDASSPYGYGGPVSSSSDPAFLAGAGAAYAGFMREQGVVVEYVRFHPLLENDRGYAGTAVRNREVVCMDLARDFQGAYPARLQQTLRKAVQAGVRYTEADFLSHAREFGAYHREAMRAMGADPSFEFPDTYFEALGGGGRARLGICTAEGAGGWLAAALFLDGPGVREYHLAATTQEGRRAGASSFLLHEGALAARAAGRSQMFLGGGTNASPDNPLLFFKGGFSPRRLEYRTGSAVFDPSAYDRLKALYPTEWAAHPERAIFHRQA